MQDLVITLAALDRPTWWAEMFALIIWDEKPHLEWVGFAAKKGVTLWEILAVASFWLWPPCLVRKWLGVAHSRLLRRSPGASVATFSRKVLPPAIPTARAYCCGPGGLRSPNRSLNRPRN